MIKTIFTFGQGAESKVIKLGSAKPTTIAELLDLSHVMEAKMLQLICGGDTLSYELSYNNGSTYGVAITGVTGNMEVPIPEGVNAIRINRTATAGVAAQVNLSDEIRSGGGQFPGFATLTASGQVVPGVAGKRIRVFAAAANSLIATNVKFQSNATDISPTYPCSDKGGLVLNEAKTPWFQTAPGEALNLAMSINTTVGVNVIYDYF